MKKKIKRAFIILVGIALIATPSIEGYSEVSDLAGKSDYVVGLLPLEFLR